MNERAPVRPIEPTRASLANRLSPGQALTEQPANHAAEPPEARERGPSFPPAPTAEAAVPANVAGDCPAWSRLYRYRKQMATQFGKDVFRLPLRRRVRDALLAQITADQRVLEVGAGSRKMGQELLRFLPQLRYESQDVDREQPHDYYCLDDAAGPYDTIFALEVVEHLTLPAIGPWLAVLRDRLRPGGSLILSTPNTFYPPAYLRDATHCTPLCYDELAGLVTASGLRVTAIYRIYHDPVHRRLLRRYLLGWLFRALGIDFAKQIVVVAQR